MRSSPLPAMLLSACLAACAASRQPAEPSVPIAAPPPAPAPATAPAATAVPAAPARVEPARTSRGTRSEPRAVPPRVAPPSAAQGIPAPVEAPAAAEPAMPPADTLSAREHAIEALKSLDRGEPEAARFELDAALRAEPDNELARGLLSQLDGNPEEMLGRESFPYTVQPGDSLSKIAKRFLGDEYRFYVLARYNGIARPSGLEVGQVLRIPGKKPAPPRAAAPPREAVREPPKEKPAPPPRASEADPEAEKLYQGGVQALSAGATERAYDLFLQALRTNPRHAQAQEKVQSLKSAVVDSYYKKAVSALRRHDLEETIRNCDKALEIDPDNERVKLRRAEALELQERLRKVQ